MINTNNSQDPNQLAEEHAEYIEKFLEAHDEPEDVKRMILFHYKSAFIHGFKHGVEAVEERLRDHKITGNKEWKRMNQLTKE